MRLGCGMDSVVIIGISAVTGGGKTAVTPRLTEVLEDAVALHFDDYDDTNVHPDDLQRWFAAGADYDAYKTPVFTGHLEALKAGRSVHYPVGGALLGPASYVVADAPLGRAHTDSGRFIELMVFIDTPLDVAMARRVLRDTDRVGGRTTGGSLESVKGELSGYLTHARLLYQEFQERMRDTSDVIADGTLSIDAIAKKIRSEIEARFPHQLVEGRND